MKIIELDYKNIVSLNEEISLCLGYFDGLHRGHQKLILEAEKYAKNKLGILTFSNPVSMFLNNKKSKEILTSNKDKIRLLNKMDIDYFFIINIDKNFLELSPLDFINQILKKLNVKEIYVGTDYRFGKSALGTPDLLEEYFDVHVIDLATQNGQKISTTNIINLLKNGDIKTANKLLGRNYEINGIVVKGHHLGSSISFPTENIKLSANYVIPKRGVYKTIIFISGIPHLSLSNVGIHPTINVEENDVIEVHIPNYNSNDYGKTIYLEFLDFIREEIKFNDIESLKTQISKDLKSIL